jgi:putative membrane protein
MDARRWWWRLSSIVVLLSGTATDAAAANGQDWGPWGMHMMWSSWGIGMMLMMFLFWAAIIVAMVFFIRWLVTAGHRGHQAFAGHGPESALDILKKRYARGEISKEEFQDMRKELQERLRRAVEWRMCQAYCAHRRKA